MILHDEASARSWLASLPGYTALAKERLVALVALLREENERQNLVSSGSLDAVWLRHIADSAQLLNHVPRGTASDPWLDLGTGAGFPGLVIAILLPDACVTMVESRTRRIDWLERVVSALDLQCARVAGSRLEQVESRPQAVISARAFAPLDRLLLMAGRFSTEETLWLLPKGRSAQQELQALPGNKHRLRVASSLTDPEAGIIIGTVSNPKGRK